MDPYSLCISIVMPVLNFSLRLSSLFKISLSSSEATEPPESTASLSFNYFPNLDLLCSNYLRVATSTSRPKPKASGGHKYFL